MANHNKPADPNADDRVTYLPLDRTGATRVTYPPTHPRQPPPMGGMRLGQPQPVWQDDEHMPGIDTAGVAAACDAVVSGKGVYRALVYLSRARLDDLPMLLRATESEQVRERWERLWVVTPTLGRLSRHGGAIEQMVQLLIGDLGAVHLLSKFSEQNNPIIKKLFARLHDPLLTGLLQALHEDYADPRRAGLISGIVAALEGDESILRALMPPKLSERAADNLIDMLYVRPPTKKHKTLRSAVLRDRLNRSRR